MKGSRWDLTKWEVLRIELLMCKVREAMRALVKNDWGSDFDDRFVLRGSVPERKRHLRSDARRRHAAIIGLHPKEQGRSRFKFTFDIHG